MLIGINKIKVKQERGGAGAPDVTGKPRRSSRIFYSLLNQSLSKIRNVGGNIYFQNNQMVQFKIENCSNSISSIYSMRRNTIPSNILEGLPNRLIGR